MKRFVPSLSRVLALAILGLAAIAPASAAQFQVTPRALDFGNVPIGATSPKQYITITNVTASTLGLGLNYVRDQFGAASICPDTLPPGGSCTVSFAFTPVVTGPQSYMTGSLTVGGTTIPLVVHGNGINAFLVTPTSLYFGIIPIGTASDSQFVTISNTSNTDLSVTIDPTNPGSPFTATYGTCPAARTTLAAGKSCVLEYYFLPTSVPLQYGTSSIVVNGVTTTILVEGAGEPAGTSPSSPLVTPTSFDFGDVPIGTIPTQSVVLTNRSASAITLNLSGGSPSNSAFEGINTCPSSLAAGAQCAIQYRFLPTVLGPQTGSATLNVNGGIYDIALQANAFDPLVFTPQSFDFGITTIGTTSAPQTMTVTNTAASPISATLNNFVANGTACPSTLAPGASCVRQFATSASTSGVDSYSVPITYSIGSYAAGFSAGILDFGTALGIPEMATVGPLPGGMQGVPYGTFDFSADNGTPPYYFSVAAGSLPFGMTLSSFGELSGTPLESGDYILNIGVSDASETYASATQFTLSIAPTSANGECGSANGSITRVTPADSTLCTSGQVVNFLNGGLVDGEAGDWQWQCAVPGGVTANCDALYYFIVNGNIVGGHGTIAAINFVDGNEVVGPAGTSAVDNEVADLGTADFQVVADPGYIANQTLTGTCVTSTTYVVFTTLSFLNQADCTVNVSFSPITAYITTPSPLPNGEPGVPYSVTIEATGGTPPYTFTNEVNPTSGFTLPPGVTFQSNGLISGTPTAVGVYFLFVTMHDAAGAYGNALYTLEIDRIFSDGFDGTPD